MDAPLCARFASVLEAFSRWMFYHLWGRAAFFFKRLRDHMSFDDQTAIQSEQCRNENWKIRGVFYFVNFAI